MVDTLLVCSGRNAAANFVMAGGFELPHPIHKASRRDEPAVVVPGRKSSDGSAQHRIGCFHIDARNVVVTHWSTSATMSTVQVRVRLAETEGLAGRVRLRAVRDISSKRGTSTSAVETLAELPVDGDCVTIDVAAVWSGSKSKPACEGKRRASRDRCSLARQATDSLIRTIP